MATATVPELFIIESLRLTDEESAFQEGRILAQTLRLSGKKKTKYYYIRTRRELEQIIKLFDKSRYRYLHISCHASVKGMATTFDRVTYGDLGAMLKPCIRGRRVFVSACQMANRVFAEPLLQDTGCYSLIGPAGKIYFDDAAAFWVTFYHLVFKLNEQGMKRRDIRHYVSELSALFDESINYFSKDESVRRGFKKIL